jgi:hypothetical protein
MAGTSKNLSNVPRDEAVAVLELLLLDGLKGKGVRVTPKWWNQFRARLVQRHKKAKRK